MRSRAWSVLVAAIAVSCASTTPFRNLSAGNAASALDQLRGIRRQFHGALAYTRMRVDAGGAKQSFNARLAVDGEGSVQIDGLTPLGTGAFTLFLRGDRVIFLNHLQHTWWRGSLGELRGRLDLFGEISSSSQLAFLLLGLPPDPDVTAETLSEPEVVTVEDGAISLVVSPGGLNRALIRGQSAVSFEFLPPSFPPQTVVITTDDGNGHRTDSAGARIEYLDLGPARKVLTEPSIPADYRRGVPPSSLQAG